MRAPGCTSTLRSSLTCCPTNACCLATTRCLATTAATYCGRMLRGASIIWETYGRGPVDVILGSSEEEKSHTKTAALTENFLQRLETLSIETSTYKRAREPGTTLVSFARIGSDTIEGGTGDGTILGAELVLGDGVVDYLYVVSADNVRLGGKTRAPLSTETSSRSS